MSAKIPPKATFEYGAKLITEVAKEIDKQVGAELETTDGSVDNEEVTRFLQERGGLSSTSGAAVAAVQAYMRKVVGNSAVPIKDMESQLGKVGGWVEKHRDKGKNMDQLPATWRALGLFAEEAKTKGLTAKAIVADRSKRPIGSQKQLAKGAAVLSELFSKIGSDYGDGKITTDAIRAYLAQGSDGVASVKPVVRQLTRVLEKRTKGTTFTQADVNKVMDQALDAFKKNASGPDDRAKLAKTWQMIASFADENATRKKDATSLAKKSAEKAKAPAEADDGGPKAKSVEGFLALDIDTKASILESYGDDMDGHYKTSGEVSIDSLPDGDLKNFALAMKKELTSIVGDFDDSHYGSIGEPRVDVEVISLPDGTIVGGNVFICQEVFNPDVREDGFDDDHEYHYDTWSEAEAAGFEEGTDNFRVSGVFQADGAGGAAQLGDYQHVSDYWEYDH